MIPLKYTILTNNSIKKNECISLGYIKPCGGG